jgi:carboxypeptidase family protein/TonB-dependent receptor-like protein
MKRILQLCAVLIVGFAAPALAQVQTGSILVKAADQQGAVMPGVTVTISSPVLVAGTMTAVTDAGGATRFPSLSPGRYTVKLELQGFQSINREDVVVLVGQTTPVDLQLKVASVSESITVTGDSPTVDTTSANVNVNLSEQLLQSTPGGRDIWALTESKVPGLVMSRPDVGGTSGGLQGVYSARGTTSAQNSQYLNGVNVGDPSAIGAAGYYYDFDSFEDIQVSTGAHDITVPTSGVFLNMVTKSGGNTWAGRTTFAYVPKGTQSSNIDANLSKFGFGPKTNQVDFTSDINVSAGGPVLANKLRVFGSFRDWRVHVNVPAAFSTTVLDQTNITSGLVNLTYQLNQSNKITGFYSHQAYIKPNRFLQSPTTTLVKDSTSDEEDRFNVYQGLWNSILTKNLFMDARLGYNTILFPTFINGNAQSLTDNATSIVTGNFTANTVRHRPRLQANATFNYYVDQALGGRHEFKFGFDQTHAAGTVETTRFDDLTATWNSATNQASTVTLFATPFNTATTVDVSSLFVQDSYSVQRLTLTAGLRYERLHGYLPDQSSPATRWTALGIPAFQNVPRTLSQTDVVTWNTAGPRVSAIYDLTGDAKTALKGSAARYYYVISTTGTPLDAVNPNGTFQAQYTWNDVNHDLVFQPGEQAGTPVITSGSTTTVDPNYRRPYTDEYSGGIDRDLGKSLKLSVVYTYRREKYPQATLNPANPFSTSLTSRADAGLDGVTGTADDTTIQFFDRLGAGNLTVVTNDPTSLQTYKGLEFTVTKRMSNRWQMLAGYTYSQARISGLSVNTDPNRLLNVTGPVAAAGNGNVAGTGLGDRPNAFKLTGSYLLPFQDILVAANFSSVSGEALTRQVNTRLTVGGTTTVNVDALGSHRLDALNKLDLRAQKTFTMQHNRAFDVSVDVNNALNTNNIWDARTLSGTIGLRQNGDINGALNTVPQFLSASQIVAPRDVRFNVAFRF